MEYERVAKAEHANAKESWQCGIKDGYANSQTCLVSSVIAASYANIGEEGMDNVGAEIDTEADAHDYDDHGDGTELQGENIHGSKESDHDRAHGEDDGEDWDEVRYEHDRDQEHDLWGEDEGLVDVWHCGLELFHIAKGHRVGDDREEGVGADLLQGMHDPSVFGAEGHQRVL